MLEKTTGVEKTNTEKKITCGKSGRRAQSGQTMTEYAILISMVSMVMVGTIGLFLSSVGSFYMNLVKVVTMPFP